ncbi:MULTISPECIES: SDR family NAD(P)-dependent oxidoreductase [unclassified Streptomyces]|uniref:SDR family NAD(P)-dependent oxidoreductase n=1 Tax=unclassified Streptomyces TaxID=2593676 RepID=UPI00037D8ACB|nr:MULTISPECIES: SDR family NAD(P)-dependent oxidoreductase [unclassified Streptomyces]MYT33695.1 SDR family NAD(P)-dependent oxidoreductase [Streptomyces sp. SID8354]
MHDVKPGDIAHSSHSFTAAEFTAFAAATGDHNPIHHDPEHAAGTAFGAPIVPLVMALGPVSALIGMVVPGPGAVILDTAFRPVRAVAFDRRVDYSLKVRSVSAATGVLTCRLLAFQDREVVLEGEIRTTVRAPRPRPDETTGGRLIPADARGLAVVTGAAGDIGSAVARELARQGWDLVLVHRGGADPLVRQCEEAGATVQSVTVDLADPAGRAAAAAEIAARTPTALVHAAAAPLAAGHQEHLEIGYAALRDLADAVLEGMLVRQRGVVVLLGSQATRYHPRGWSDYVAAKAAAESVLHGIDRHHGAHGIRTVVVEPGYVQGGYSAAVRPADVLGLLPEEVAELVAAELRAADAPARRVWLTPEGVTRFALDGAQEAAAPPAASPASPPVHAERAAPAPGTAPNDLTGRVEAAVRSVLGAGADVREGGVGLTPGWDSLGQIQIVLAVEAEFGIRLPAASLTGTGRFDQLCRVVAEQVGA